MYVSIINNRHTGVISSKLTRAIWLQLKVILIYFSVYQYLFRFNKKDTNTMPKDAVLLLSMFTLNRYLHIGLSLTLSIFNTLR